MTDPLLVKCVLCATVFPPSAHRCPRCYACHRCVLDPDRRLRHTTLRGAGGTVWKCHGCGAEDRTGDFNSYPATLPDDRLRP